MTYLLGLLWIAGCKEPLDSDPPPVGWVDTAVYQDFVPVVDPGKTPKNVLMISIDTLRRDHVGRYGGADTPFLDGLLATGVALDDHVACSNWTFGSATCALTGAYPEELGFLPSLGIVPEQLPNEADTLAERLAEAGLHGILATSNTWISPISGLGQGYERVHVGGEDGQSATQVWAAGAALLDEAIAEGEAERWFLHLHLLEPHAPYAPPETYLDGLAALEPSPWDLSDKGGHYEIANDWPALSPEDQQLLEAHLRVRYAGEVAWLDDQLTTIWSELDARGWLDDTLVVLWSDHGEQFWEHGRQTHAWQLHGEENDSVALFWAKDLAAAAFDGPTSSVDLVPTVLQALDLPVPVEIVGVPIGAGRVDRARFAVAEARSGTEQAIVRDGFKLRYHWSGVVQLFDLETDPGEKVNLWDPEDPVSLELWEVLQSRTAALEPLTIAEPTAPAGL